MKFKSVKDEVIKAHNWLKKEIIEIKSIGHLKVKDIKNVKVKDIKNVKDLFNKFEWLLINHIYNIIFLSLILYNKQLNKRNIIMYGVTGYVYFIYNDLLFPSDDYEDEIVEEIFKLLKLKKFKMHKNYNINITLRNYYWNGDERNFQLKL